MLSIPIPDSGIDEKEEEEEDPLIFERQLDDVFNVMASGQWEIWNEYANHSTLSQFQHIKRCQKGEK